jgi:ketosteroid isomerase-like protein
MNSQANAVANAFGAAIHARSCEQLLAIYADDIVVWHGSTGQAMGKSANAAMLSGVFRLTSELEYINIRRHPIEDGVIQQHRLIGRFADGKALPDLEACLIIKVRNGLIERIEEYFDGSVFADVWERLAALPPEA